MTSTRSHNNKCGSVKYVIMFSLLLCLIIGFSILVVIAAPSVSVLAIELNFSNGIDSYLKNNLKLKINDLVSNALNDTDDIVNTSIC